MIGFSFYMTFFKQIQKSSLGEFLMINSALLKNDNMPIYRLINDSMTANLTLDKDPSKLHIQFNLPLQNQSTSMV